MSIILDFCQNNSFPSIFYGNNHFPIHNASSKLLKIFIESSFCLFLKLPLRVFQKNQFFLVNLRQFVDHYKARKMKGLFEVENEI